MNVLFVLGVMEIFDVSFNSLVGRIPSELSKFIGIIRLVGNLDL